MGKRWKGLKGRHVLSLVAAGIVAGNFVSEWTQVLGLVLMTKKLIEAGSRRAIRRAVEVETGAFMRRSVMLRPVWQPSISRNKKRLNRTVTWALDHRCPNAQISVC